MIIGNLESGDVKKTKSTNEEVDLRGFFELVQTAISQELKQTGSPDGNNIPVFTESNPKERFEKPDAPFVVITYKVKFIEPAESAKGITPLGGQVFSANESMDASNYKSQALGFIDLYTISFNIWSKSNPSANIWALWFVKFMRKWIYIYNYFSRYGIKNLRFEKRLEDDVDNSTDQELYIRPLIFSFRNQTIFRVAKRTLTSIDFNAVEVKHNIGD